MTNTNISPKKASLTDSDPPPLSPVPTHRLTREQRFQRALLDSAAYRPINQSWFHPKLRPCGPTAPSRSGSLTPPAFIPENLKDFSLDQLLGLIHYSYSAQQYQLTIDLSRFTITHQVHSHNNDNSNTLDRRKLSSILETALACFKRLLTSNPTDHVSFQSDQMLDEFLKLSEPNWQLVPSLGVVAAPLLVKMGRCDDALIAITPALLHCGDFRIRSIIEDILTNTQGPKSSETFVKHLLANNARPNSIAHHLGLATYVSNSTVPPDPWSHLLNALLETGNITTIDNDPVEQHSTSNMV